MGPRPLVCSGLGSQLPRPSFPAESGGGIWAALWLGPAIRRGSRAWTGQGAQTALHLARKPGAPHRSGSPLPHLINAMSRKFSGKATSSGIQTAINQVAELLVCMQVKHPELLFGRPSHKTLGAAVLLLKPPQHRLLFSYNFWFSPYRSLSQLLGDYLLLCFML